MNNITLELSVQALNDYQIEGTEIRDIDEAKQVISNNMLTLAEILTYLICK